MQNKQAPGPWLFAAALLGTCLSAGAAQPYQEYRKHVESAQTITALTDELMGDSISLYNGATEFTATDISLPGNNALPVELKRRFSIEITPSGSPGGNAGDPNFRGAGNWDVEVPYINGVYGDQPWEAARCTNGASPVVPAPLDVTDVWQGNTVHVPGSADRKMLKRVWAQIPQPSDGVERKWTTRERDMFTCIPMQSGLAGEGFLMQTASGLRYYFDRATTRYAGPMTYQPNPYFFPFTLNRTKYYLLASKIVDRFGNSVNFTYNPNGSPTSIVSSDGRAIVLTYIGTLLDKATVSDAVSGIDRTWQYDYGTGAEAGMLKTVTQPDGSKWQYTHAGTLFPDDGGIWDGNSNSSCGNKPPAVPASFAFTVTHPSGAVGAFQFANKRQPRSGIHMNACVDRLVQQDGTWVHTYKLYTPNYFDVMAVSQKTITEPGVASRIWTYEFPFGTGALWGTRGQSFTYPCSTCPSEKTVTVHEPGDVTKEYRYGYLYASNEGRLLGTTTIDSGGVAKRLESTEYLPESEAAGQNFYPLYGAGFGADDPSSVAVRPVIAHTIEQDGATFSMQVDTGCGGTAHYCFDVYGQPTSVTKSSTVGDSKTELSTYDNNTNLWVLGQEASTAIGGTIVSETGYDALARPVWSKSFGKLQQTLTYYTGSTASQLGTVASISDGRDTGTLNTTVLLSNWKRGIPQSIVHPVASGAPAEMETAVVNDDGTLASIKNEAGFTTGYAYDAMGRVSQVTYPTGDSVAWNATTMNFARSAISRYGLPAGYWLRIVDTGKGRTAIHYDALWRPVVEESFDNTSQATINATQSVVVKRYDDAGRLEFQSYPVRSLTNWTDATLKGTHTTYDALARPLLVKQDSELGMLTTKTEYLSGFKTRTTNPRGQQTLTTYMAWDEPTFDYPIAITHPEGAITAFSRDVFGKPTAIVRRNADSTIKATRSYLYGGAERLCMVTEPETGSTVVWFDEAGNLIRSAAGLTIPSGTSCPDAKALAATSGRAVTRTYDQRNRLETLVFPDHRGDTNQTYTPDGKLASITVDNGGADQVTTSYAYNRRRLPTQELLSWANGNVDWLVGYTYDKNGALSAQAWHGLDIAYAPNALGQPTQAGAYAQDVTYHPNGAIAGFTYGNGITHTLSQNLRGLPDTSSDVYGSTKFLADGYDYDQNGNVSAISDGRPGQRGNRDFTYDGLDRLKTAQSIMFGNTGTVATASYAYDVLDNLTRVVVPATASGPARNHYYCYDAKWRLTNVKTGSCTGTSVIGLGYDVQGNLANKNGVTYAFDYGNRLRSTGGTLASSYLYDGHGRRIVDQTSGRKVSQYTQAGQLALTSDARTGIVTEYVYLQGSLVATQERTGSVSTGVYTTKYQHTDALGSPVAVTGDTRTILEKSEFEPYGRLANRALTDGPGYTGHVSDAATGLSYMQQRYYDPGIGRFLSVDPISANSSTGANLNRYSYAKNNPYTFFDPDGRDAVYFQDVDVLVIPVYFSGAAATPANVAAIGSRMKAIQSDWGGMKVRLQVLQSPSGYGTNRMSLEPTDDFKNYPKAGEGANDFGGNRAHINTSRPNWIGAAVHDLLHLAGAPEGYIERGSREGRTSTPKSGYTSDHIMAERSGFRLSGADVDNITRNDTTIKTNLNGFKGVFRVEGRLDSKRLDKELSK